MAKRFEILHRTIAQSGQVSSVFELQGTDKMGLLVSLITSCEAYWQVSFSTTSADFRRAFKTDGTSVWTWGVASGRAAVDLKDVGGAFPFGRLETSVAQENVCSLAVVMKL